MLLLLCTIQKPHPTFSSKASLASASTPTVIAPSSPLHDDPTVIQRVWVNDTNRITYMTVSATREIGVGLPSYMVDT